MICACPCGEEFEPKRSNQVYFNAEHRKKDKNRRWPRIRLSVFPAAFRDALRKRQEAQTSGFQPLLGTEMAQTNRERFREKLGKRKSGEFLSSYQVADLLGLSPWALIAWRRQHRGPQFIRIGRNTIRYLRRELEAWLASLRPAA